MPHIILSFICVCLIDLPMYNLQLIFNAVSFLGGNSVLLSMQLIQTAHIVANNRIMILQMPEVQNMLVEQANLKREECYRNVYTSIMVRLLRVITA